MDEDHRSRLNTSPYWSIKMISYPPPKHHPVNRFKLARSIIEKNLALLDPEDFLSQALRYYQNYLQHKEQHVDMNQLLTKNNLLRFTAGNWLEELLGTNGKQAMESSSMDDHRSDKQLTTEIEMATGMEIDLPESETDQTSFVEMPSEARGEPQDPT
ncbi:hypothetical protein LZL87_008515 [Fusarium oxysporum]|nr:hypothetical protein LZL87_008515 [Fusarium oxysporum]